MTAALLEKLAQEFEILALSANNTDVAILNSGDDILFVCGMAEAYRYAAARLRAAAKEEKQ